MIKNDEREFLHDIASPLGAAMLHTDALVEKMQGNPNTDPVELNQLMQVNQALERMKIKLQERRATLIARGVPSSKI